MAVHDEVLGGSHQAIGQKVLRGLGAHPPSVAAVIAVTADTAVSAGRVGFPTGSDFASLWGGGTLPAWRGGGIFRALVAHRAALARDRGYQYPQVDASSERRPILQRLGFAEMAKTTPYRYARGQAGPPRLSASGREFSAAGTGRSGPRRTFCLRGRQRARSPSCSRPERRLGERSS